MTSNYVRAASFTGSHHSLISLYLNDAISQLLVPEMSAHFLWEVRKARAEVLEMLNTGQTPGPHRCVRQDYNMVSHTYHTSQNMVHTTPRLWSDRSVLIPLHHHKKGGVWCGFETLRQTHTSTYVHTNTHT